MKRLILKMFLLSAIIAGLTAGLLVRTVMRKQKSADGVYKLGATHRYLFIGSSEIGCGIEESTSWSNRVIWVSDALTETFLMRLKEFERRGQLGGGVKTVVVPFNFVTFTRQKADSIKWSWYKELPVSVRYLDMLPCSKLEFARYIACNLRYPLPMLLQSGFPKGRTSIARLPERRREKNLSMFENEGRSIVLGKDSLPNWEGRIFGAYREMKEICTRNGTGFAILRMPVLPQYRNATGDDVRELEDEFVKRFRNDGMEVLEVKVDLTAADFFDNVHLVESGRAVLTERVIARLAELNRR